MYIEERQTLSHNQCQVPSLTANATLDVPNKALGMNSRCPDMLIQWRI